MPSHSTHWQCFKQPEYWRKKQTKNLSSGNWIVCSVCIVDLHGLLVWSGYFRLAEPEHITFINNISNHSSTVERADAFLFDHINVERKRDLGLIVLLVDRKLSMERSNISLHTLYTHTLSQASRSIVGSKVPWCFLSFQFNYNWHKSKTHKIFTISIETIQNTSDTYRYYTKRTQFEKY